MRSDLGVLCVLGTTALSVVPARAHAEEPSPSNTAGAVAPPAVTLPAVTPPAVTPEDLAALRAELSQQRQELAELKAREDERARQPPAVRASGYAQVDLILHNQASQNEINYSTGTPLNQDRFTLRRGTCVSMPNVAT